MRKRPEPAPAPMRNRINIKVPAMIAVPGGGYVRSDVPTVPAPTPSPVVRQTIGVQPKPRYDYETAIRTRAEEAFPQPTEPYPTYTPTPVADRKAPTRPKREKIPAPKRNLKGEGREALKAGLLSLLFGGLPGAIGALQGFGQGANLSDAERRRQYEDELFAGDVDYENAMADWATATDQIGLDTQSDALRRQENQFGYGAGVDRYGAGFNERQAQNQNRQAGTQTLAGLYGQNQSRDLSLLDLSMRLPEYAGQLGALNPAIQKSLTTRQGQLAERLGMEGGLLPVPGQPGGRNMVTGEQLLNPNYTPGPRERLTEAQAREADAMAKLVVPKFNHEVSMDIRRQREIERSNRAGESLTAAGQRIANLTKLAGAGGQTNTAELTILRGAQTNLNALIDAQRQLSNRQATFTPGSAQYEALAPQLDAIDEKIKELNGVIDGVQEKLMPGIKTKKQDTTPAPRPGSASIVGGLRPGAFSAIPGADIGIGGIPPVVMDPGTGKPFVRPTPPKAKKPAPKPTPKPTTYTIGGVTFTEQQVP